MNTQISNRESTKFVTTQENAAPSVETRNLLSLGRKNNWGFQVLGRAPMPERATRLGDWLLVPAQIDSSSIPSRTLARIQAIFTVGIRPKGFVLAHEAPKLLPSPTTEGNKLQDHFSQPIAKTTPIRRTESPQRITELFTTAMSGLGTLLSGLLTILGSLILPAAYLVGAVIMLDPILVAVTEDGYWIEIDRWWNEPNQ